MTRDEMLINTLITETLDKAESDITKTWDDFYQTLSDDAKSGYEWLIDTVCGYEDHEKAYKYISKDDVFEAIVIADKTDIDSLVDYLVSKVLKNMEWAAECEYQARYDAECERADLAYKMMVEERMGIC